MSAVLGFGLVFLVVYVVCLIGLCWDSAKNEKRRKGVGDGSRSGDS